jgi:hypothetical protein
VAADGGLMLGWVRSGEFTVNRSFCCIRVIAALAAIAINVAGCADSRLAANNAATSGTQPPSPGYQTGYGVSSNGFTTDLYTEMFGSNQRDDKTAPSNEKSASATTPSANASGTASPATVVSAPVPSNTVQQAQPTQVSGVRQEVSAAETSHPTVYGIPSDGPTTDLFTELFGPRRRE